MEKFEENGTGEQNINRRHGKRIMQKEQWTKWGSGHLRLRAERERWCQPAAEVRVSGAFKHLPSQRLEDNSIVRLSLWQPSPQPLRHTTAIQVLHPAGLATIHASSFHASNQRPIYSAFAYRTARLERNQSEKVHIQNKAIMLWKIYRTNLLWKQVIIFAYF